MKSFGTLSDGTGISSVTIGDGSIRAEILTYGGTVRRLLVPDRGGNAVDVACGFDTLEGYVDHTAFFGALIGRVCNRIGGASFDLNGVRYELNANDGVNQLHSGPTAFHRMVWTVAEETETSVTLTLHDPDGHENFPGDLDVTVRYTAENGSLRIEYDAVSDRDTLCNLTNHLYFNLGGHDSGSVLDQVIRLNADAFTPTDAASIPTGEVRDVTGTPMDLRIPQRIGDHIDDDYGQLRMAGGYDHNWCLNGEGLRTVAEAECRETGIALEVITDAPGCQFYTGNFMACEIPGKGGCVYGKRNAFCLETQIYPDAIHHDHFPSVVLKAGERFHTQTVYAFSSR